MLHLPERFVIGTVAALRMLTLLQDDLDAMRRSRRARGIAEFKVPDQIVFIPSFQTTAVGKVSRNVLRAELRARYLAEENT